MTGLPERKGIRPEPAPFRRAAVARVVDLTPFLARVSFTGDELSDLSFEEPAASVRLFLPFPGMDELPEIHWDGNRYRLADGTRPVIRTFTPLNHEPSGSLDLEVVLHDAGATTQWLRTVSPGAVVAISEPGRGYTIDQQAESYALLGDESALPAIRQLIGRLEDTVAVQVAVELQHRAAALDLPDRSRFGTRWVVRDADELHGAALIRATRELEITENTRVWAAGEAGAMRALRRQLFDERGMDRSAATVRGYWKHGR